MTWARRAVSLVLTLAVVGLTAYLWPAPLGGATRMVVVSGTSMEPTYELGDVVVARRGGAPSVGEVVVFEVPSGVGAGKLVIHRVVGQRDDGTFVTQGDNRETADEFRVGAEHVVGRPVAHLPRAGLLVGLLRQGWVLAVIVGMIVMLVLWPERPEPAEEEVAVPVPLFGPLPPPELSPEVLAAAEAWLAEQLAAA